MGGGQVRRQLPPPVILRSHHAGRYPARNAGNIYVHGGFNAEVGIMGDFYTCCLYDQPPRWKEFPKSKFNPGPLRNHTLSNHLANLILVGGQRNVIENNE